MKLSSGDKRFDMTLKVEKLAGKPIIIFTFSDPLEPQIETEETARLVVQFKQECGGTVYRILDFSEAHLDFGLMILGMGRDRYHDGGLTDPNVVTLYVTPDPLAVMGVECIQRQEYYGRVPARLFETRADAIQFADQDSH
jgi:hypothetical protein